MVRERGGAPPRRVVSALDATGVGPSDVRPPRGHGNGDGSVTRLPELAKRKQKCIISEEDGEENFVLQKALSAAWCAKPQMLTGLYNFKLGLA